MIASLLLIATAAAQDPMSVDLTIVDIADPVLMEAVAGVEPEIAALAGLALRKDPRAELISAPTFHVPPGQRAFMETRFGHWKLSIELVVEPGEAGHLVDLRIDESWPSGSDRTTQRLRTQLIVPDGGVEVLQLEDRVLIVQVHEVEDRWRASTKAAQLLYERLIWHSRPARRAARLDELLGLAD